jgi:hypothetical protein
MKAHLFRSVSLRALIGGGVLAAAVASTALPNLVQAQARPPALIELSDSSLLRAQFNRDDGMIRLVLLVSPT